MLFFCFVSSRFRALVVNIICYQWKSVSKKNFTRLTGFTLFEVMVAVAILSLGVVLIYRTFLTSLATFKYYSTNLQAQCWMGEKIWEVEDSLLYRKGLGAGKRSGNLFLGNRKIAWRISVDSISPTEEFYQLDLTLFWQENNRRITISRTTYIGI